MRRHTWLIFGGLLLAAAGTLWADELAVSGTHYRDVYIREGVNRYYVQIPETGNVVSVAKEEVVPGSLVISQDSGYRASLLQRWRAKSGQPPAVAIEKSSGVAGETGLKTSPDSAVPVPRVLRAQGTASQDKASADALGARSAEGGTHTGVHLRDVPLGDALRATLRPMNLDYEVRGNMIYISTPDRLRQESWERLETRSYALRTVGSDSLPKIVLRNAYGSAGNGYGGGSSGGVYGNYTGRYGGPQGYQGGQGGGYGGTGYGGYGGYRGGNAGGGYYGRDVTMISNISDMFSTIDDRLVGEGGPVKLTPQSERR